MTIYYFLHLYLEQQHSKADTAMLYLMYNENKGF